MKFEWLRHIGRKKTVLIASVCLVLMAAAGLTVAWLTAQSALMSNGFQKAEVTCDIEETFDGQTKSDVCIRNTGTISAYIRAALVPVWKDGENIAGISASLSDCDITLGPDFSVQWAKGADGYYYCLLPVPAGDTTPVLIDSCTAPILSGYQFELQITAQAVQALPVTAVQQAWGCGTGTNGKLEVTP